jgi:urea transporter
MSLSEQEKHLLMDLERSLSDDGRPPRIRSARLAVWTRYRGMTGVLLTVLGLVLALVGVGLNSVVGTVVAVFGSAAVILGINWLLDATFARRTRTQLS